MKQFTRVLLLVLTLSALCACKSTTKLSKSNPSSDIKFNTASKAMAALLEHSFVTPYYVASFNIKTEIAGQVNTCSGQIRMKKDEHIWISLNKLGIEFARILVRPDSLYLLNRIERTHSSIPAFFLESLIGMNVDFDQIQHILVSAISKPYSYQWVNPIDTAGVYLFERKKDRHRPLTHLAVSMDDAHIQYYNYLIPNEVNVNVRLENYEDFEGCRVAKQIVIEATGKIQNKLTITYTKRAAQEMDIPFAIPSSYKKTEL